MTIISEVIPGDDLGGNYLSPEEDKRRRELLEAAVGYAKRGLAIMPVNWVREDGTCSCLGRSRKTECRSAAKHPVHDRWPDLATSDESEVAHWWREAPEGIAPEWWPKANVGIVTGAASGVFVLDVDPGNGGDESLGALERRHGPLPETRVHSTGSGGTHYFFRYPGDIRNSASKVTLGKGLDIRGEGGQVVAPPSVSTKGAYELNPAHDIEPAEAPAWLLELLRQSSTQGRMPVPGRAPDAAEAQGYVESAVRSETEKVRDAPEGERNDTLNCAAFALGTLGGSGYLDEDRAWSALHDAAIAAGLGEGESRATFMSGWNSGVQKPRHVELRTAGRQAALVLPPPGTPLTAAQEITRQFYTSPAGMLLLRWHRGDFYRRTATHWQECSQAGMRSELYQVTGSAVCTEEREGKDGTTAEMHIPWNPNRDRIANLSEALGLGVVHLDEAVEPGSWIEGSHGGHLIPVRNGLLDRDTRKLHPHSPGHFGTWALPYDYDPDAPPPVHLLEFLDSVFPGEPETVSRLQEWAGYLVSGDTRLQKIGLLVGPPRAGKGTLMTLFEQLLGGENCVSPTLFSLSGRFGQEQLIGKQLAQFKDESFEGRSTDMAVAVTWMKTISGAGDSSVSIDRKGKAAWTGRPGVRFNISANELPGLKDASAAIAGRFFIFIFRNSFLDREDETLGEKLRGELPSVFNWALDGWDRVRDRGRLVETEQTLADRVALASAGSVHRRFAEECLETGPGYEVSRELVWDTWRRWCADEGVPTGIRNTLGQKLRSVIPELGGCQHSKVWFYTGIRLAQDAGTGLRLVTAHADAPQAAEATPGSAS